MIECLMILSRSGILRFLRIYSEDESKISPKKLVADTISYIASSNNTQIIYDFPYTAKEKRKIVYRSFGNVFLISIIDDLENELAMLDFINVLMHAMNEVFMGICESHVIMNPDKLYLLFDEAICGGTVIETETNKIIKAYKDKNIENDNYKYFS